MVSGKNSQFPVGSMLAPTPPSPRPFGAFNWLGLWTLYLKEVRRFVKVATQTLLAPVVTTLLFLAIFPLALGRAVETVGGVSFVQFLAPGARKSAGEGKSVSVRVD